MAAKRIAQSSINWASLAERVPPNQKTNFTAFKSRSDKYLRSVMANPALPPKIDWAYYKSRVAAANLVDQFQKSYEGLTIPYPADTLTSAVEAQSKEVRQEIDNFKAESQSRITEYKKNIDHLKSLLPFDQMTMEDYKDSYPELALDPSRPTFWPHNPEEQLDYKDKDAPPPGAH